MRVVVLGAGAIGSFVGGSLAAVGHEVVLVGRRPHVDAVNEAGLTITGQSELHVHPEATTECKGLPPADVLLVTVKAHSTRRALSGAGDAIGEETFVCSLQNGLGNLEVLHEVVEPERAIGAVTSHGVVFEAPGHVVHTGTGDTVLGPPQPPDLPAHHELGEALTEAGIATEVVADIRPRLWEKAAVNAAINPITAITGLPNGALLEVEELSRLSEAVAREVEAVARARGVDVEEGAWVATARQVAERTARNRSSMLQDVQRGRPTEIEAISGRIAQVGREEGVGAELNRALHALVKGIEATLHYDA